MQRRQFLSTGLISSASLIGLNGCSSLPNTLPSTLSLSSNVKPIVDEFNGSLNSAPMYWTNVMLQAARSLNISPLIASRTFAMSHFAGYLALTGEGLTLLGNANKPTGINSETAYGVALSYALEDALDTSFALQRKHFINHQTEQTNGNDLSVTIAWAKSQANRVIKLRTKDGTERSKANLYPAEYEKQNHSLSWSPTGPFYGAKNGPGFTSYERGLRPAWGVQKTWLIGDATHYRAEPFPELNSDEFKRQYEKVKVLGDTSHPSRTAEQNEISLFWEDGLMGITVPGHFQLVAMQLINQRKLNLEQQAKLFALLSIGQADAAIVAWDNKYHFDVIRPETAIRFANSRLNSSSSSNNFKQKSNWNSYIPSPPFPAYISGHSIFGATSCDILAAFMDGDQINLTSPAPDMVNWPSQLKDVRRQYNSLRQMAEENGMSREYGGVHWEIDNTEGLRLGYDIASNSIQQFIG